MNAPAIDPKIIEKAQTWLVGNFDEETKKQVEYLMHNDPTGLVDSFYQDLEFGTGGLRGIMGVGSNRMNKYTVGMATQGLANYLKICFPGQTIKTAVAFDSRNNNTLFAKVTADVLSANGIHVVMFEEMRPVPELSFTVRHLQCQCGIVITASHNPKEYNGYKVYGPDGGQLVSPHDKNVITEVQKIKTPDDVNFNANASLIKYLGEEIDAAYLSKVKSLSLSPEIIKKHHDLNIVYTPIHGTGIKLVPQALAAFGFTNINLIEEQCIPDGNFPTVKSPNPEEKSALAIALKKAQQIDADLVLATDPDSDRVGIAVKDTEGNFVLMNGNQTITVMLYYILAMWKKNGKLTGKEFVVKTIVTTQILDAIAEKFKTEIFTVLTGFKFIAELIEKNYGKKTFIAGGEESYGYLSGDFVRDKDAVSACCMIAETAVWAKEQGLSMYELLLNIYTEFGLYKEDLINVVKKGKAGADEINAMMTNYRTSPPSTINHVQVKTMRDFQQQIEKDMVAGNEKKMDHLPKSNVLQFILNDGTMITVRPSGTEPKIKFYFGVKEALPSKDMFAEVNASLDKKVKDIIESMNLS